ncbi:MAG: hypothetical protein M1813_004647 [Trichoglossum hirsutum]|nr:MAG: hypothetical protein M1813_004647 [Trichoglossum hirsutum]
MGPVRHMSHFGRSGALATGTQNGNSYTTALLQGITSILLMEPSATIFTAHVPYSMRRLTGNPVNIISDHIPTLYINYDGSFVSGPTRNISVEDRPPVVSLTWLDGIVEDSQFESLASKVETIYRL